MCKVKNIEECAKKVYVYTNDGKAFSSEWFYDDERKNTYGAEVFTLQERKHYNELLEKNHVKEEDITHWAVNRDKSESDCVFISRHAFDRMKERNGWNKKTALRMTKKVYDNGLAPSQVKGEYRAWALHRAAKYPESTMKFYGQNLYVFQNNVLVTVLQAKKVCRQALAG